MPPKAMCDGWSGGGGAATVRCREASTYYHYYVGVREEEKEEGLSFFTSKDLAALVCVSEGSENGPRCRSKARVKICWPDIVTL